MYRKKRTSQTYKEITRADATKYLHCLQLTSSANLHLVWSCKSKISSTFTPYAQLDSNYQCHKTFLLGRRQQTTVSGQHFLICRPSCRGLQQSLLKGIFIDSFDVIYFTIIIYNMYVFEKYVINRFVEKYDKTRS